MNKNFAKTLALLGLSGLMTLSASAQLKIGTIDMRKAFDNYWKTKQADATLKDRASSLDKERKAMVDEYQKLSDEYKKALDGANDQAVSADERERRKSTAEAKLVDMKEKEGEIKQFDTQARTTLGEQQRRMRDNIVGEIRAVITAKAKTGGFTLVLDTAGESSNNTPFILYSSGLNDFTDAVLTELNATAPPGLLGTGEKKNGTQK